MPAMRLDDATTETSVSPHMEMYLAATPNMRTDTPPQTLFRGGKLQRAQPQGLTWFELATSRHEEAVQGNARIKVGG